MDIYPRLHDKSVDVKLHFANAGKKAEVTLSCDGKEKKIHSDSGRRWHRNGQFPLGDNIRLWDEFSPELYTLTATMGKDTVSDKFGMREIKIVDRQFYVNDRPVYMRGTVENCTFPSPVSRPPMSIRGSECSKM